MRKILYLMVVFTVILALSGCVTVKKVTRERVDQDISGNRGYIQGQVPEGPDVAKSKTREYIDIKVEIPTWQEITKGPSEPQKKTKAVAAPAEEEELEIEIEEYDVVGEDVATVPAPAPIEEGVGPTIYKVKKGDTLGHIAKRFYNKASKWTLIYEANMDKIKDPKIIRPGTELIIPELEEESEYIK